MTHPLSLSYYTVPELDPPVMIEIAAACGCQHVGLRLLASQPGRDMLPIMEDRELRRATRQRLQDSGLAVFDANTARLTPATNVADFRAFFEVAAELGARHALATGDDPDEGRLVDRLAALCDMASAYDMSVQLEFVPWLSVSDLAAAAAMVKRVGRVNLGIALDALHFDRSGSTLDEIAAVPSERFAYMHFCDAPAEWSRDRGALLHTAVKERLLPGEGGIDLVGLLHAMPADIPLALEIPTETLARRMAARDRVALAIAATRRVLEKAASLEAKG